MNMWLKQLVAALAGAIISFTIGSVIVIGIQMTQSGSWIRTGISALIVTAIGGLALSGLEQAYNMGKELCVFFFSWFY